MLRTARKGFTLIELLIVVVIIGILAAVAIPKFASTKDKAKLSSVKTDVRNLMSVMEGLASNNGAYVMPAATDYNMSPNNENPVIALDGTTGYTITVTNTSISDVAHNSCTVQVGTAATVPTDDGKIICP
jgi:prepilin-type N-terminal cleavage/methylation domain-containing protein